jgi:carboxyl-terminal processing protease
VFPHLAHPRRLRAGALATMVATLAVMAGCGGGGGDGGTFGGPDNAVRASTCTVADNKRWLADYFLGNVAEGVRPHYFWYATSPQANPNAYPDTAAYFNALLYTGTDPAFAARDRWSGYQSTASFNSFFGDGQSLGYGIFVSGVEVQDKTLPGWPNLPLYVRYVEPLSPAAQSGVVRGDRIVSVNGRAASELIAAEDYAVLNPASSTEQVDLVLADTQGRQRTLTVPAEVYNLAPVTGASIVTTPQGRRMGYLVVKDMISQASSGLASAFALFSRNNVTELTIDLRYNGGGLISTAAEIASYAAAASDNGRIFSRLIYNDRKASSDRDYLFGALPNQLGLNRVFVLAGPRTCSASEQLVNGLRGIGIEVVMIGDTTCGKPVGFLPQDNGCGTTYSVVNFESANALNDGRYFDGFAACPVAEDFTQPLGAVTEPLLNTARLVADGAACAVASAPARERVQSLRARGVAQPMVSDGERPMALPR